MQVKRVGGGYGAKISRSVQIACVCALVCHKLNKPARFVMPIEDNMRSIGKRFTASIEYEVGTDSNGLIQYQNVVNWMNSGSSFNETQASHTLSGYFNCYDTATWNSICYDVLTDIPSNTWCRAPGEFFLKFSYLHYGKSIIIG